MVLLERACEIQIAAQSGDAALRMLDEGALRATAGVIEKADLRRDWAAMLRLIERVAPQFRT